MVISPFLPLRYCILWNTGPIQLHAVQAGKVQKEVDHQARGQQGLHPCQVVGPLLNDSATS